jgi:hypothetical protein
MPVGKFRPKGSLHSDLLDIGNDLDEQACIPILEPCQNLFASGEDIPDIWI